MHFPLPSSDMAGFNPFCDAHLLVLIADPSHLVQKIRNITLTRGTCKWHTRLLKIDVTTWKTFIDAYDWDKSIMSLSELPSNTYLQTSSSRLRRLEIILLSNVAIQTTAFHETVQGKFTWKFLRSIPLWWAHQIIGAESFDCRLSWLTSDCICEEWMPSTTFKCLFLLSSVWKKIYFRCIKKTWCQMKHEKT